MTQTSFRTALAPIVPRSVASVENPPNVSNPEGDVQCSVLRATRKGDAFRRRRGGRYCAARVHPVTRRSRLVVTRVRPSRTRGVAKVGAFARIIHPRASSGARYPSRGAWIIRAVLSCLQRRRSRRDVRACVRACVPAHARARSRHRRSETSRVCDRAREREEEGDSAERMEFRGGEGGKEGRKQRALELQRAMCVCVRDS